MKNAPEIPGRNGPSAGRSLNEPEIKVHGILKKKFLEIMEEKDLGAGMIVATVDGSPVKDQIKGIIRGMLRDGNGVWKRMKAGDIDARGIKESCYTVSDKTMAIGGGVLEGILYHFNR